mmetsp:Transcript_114362/g.227579  ORF Transcript_114362/g.227579 Transcript_114362/m.227579 type:complete len:256 (-) Transcript_114362:2661-3428(-)
MHTPTFEDCLWIRFNGGLVDTCFQFLWLYNRHDIFVNHQVIQGSFFGEVFLSFQNCPVHCCSHIFKHLFLTGHRDNWLLWFNSVTHFRQDMGSSIILGHDVCGFRVLVPVLVCFHHRRRRVILPSDFRANLCQFHDSTILGGQDLFLLTTGYFLHCHKRIVFFHFVTNVGQQVHHFCFLRRSRFSTLILDFHHLGEDLALCDFLSFLYQDFLDNGCRGHTCIFGRVIWITDDRNGITFLHSVIHFHEVFFERLVS